MPLILVAIPQEWNQQICTELQAHGYSTVHAHSQQEADTILAGPTKPDGVIIVSDWAIAHFDGEADGIVKHLQGKIPTVTIVTETSRKKSGYRYIDESYFPPLHDYITTPVPLEALIPCLKKIGIV